MEMYTGKSHKAYFNITHSKVCADRQEKNQKGETVKKPEITEDYNRFMQGVDKACHILHYYPCCRKTVKWRKKYVFFLLHRTAINSSTLFKTFKTNQYIKGTGCAFKAFIQAVLIK
jgi:hypothetical protein